MNADDPTAEAVHLGEPGLDAVQPVPGRDAPRAGVTVTPEGGEDGAASGGDRVPICGKCVALPGMSTEADLSAPTAEEAEFYPTPPWAIDRIAEAIALPGNAERRAYYIDPCVGGNAIPSALSHLDRHWFTVDIRDTGHARHVGNYLAMGLETLGHYDACVMNPPFSKALHFADRALKHCDLVIMLQRLNWLASEERAAWLRENPPDAIYVLPNRIDFTGDGGASDEYCWYVWNGGEPGIHVLNSTPLAIRTAQKPTAPTNPQMEMWGKDG